jgi:hypothetical protein
MNETTTRGPMGRHVDIHRKAAWDAALTEYHAANEAIRETADYSHSQMEAANRTHAALTTLVRTRAPDLDAMHEKVRILRAELGESDFAAFTQLMADIDHLN